MFDGKLKKNLELPGFGSGSGAGQAEDQRQDHIAYVDHLKDGSEFAIGGQSQRGLRKLADTEEAQLESDASKAESSASKSDSESIKYPIELAPRGDTVDKYTNSAGETVEVAEPYRFLEDSDSEATKKWIAAENKIT